MHVHFHATPPRRQPRPSRSFSIMCPPCQADSCGRAPALYGGWHQALQGRPCLSDAHAVVVTCSLRVQAAKAGTGSGVRQPAQGALPASSSRSRQAPARALGNACKAAADGRRPPSSARLKIGPPAQGGECSRHACGAQPPVRPRLPGAQEARSVDDQAPVRAPVQHYPRRHGAPGALFPHAPRHVLGQHASMAWGPRPRHCQV
jgi:hypothetical protein